MTNVYLDPIIFACPSSEDGNEAFEEYIKNLISWRELTSIEWANVFISDQTLDLLAITNSYPLWPNLERVIAELEMEDIQPHDVLTIFNSLLQKTLTFEEFFGINDILVESLHCSPSIQFENVSSSYQEHHERLLMFICLLQKLNEIHPDDQIMITKFSIMII